MTTVDADRAREVLGVVAGARPDELRRAYRRHAARHHPDRGGDALRFAEGRVAFDVLTRVRAPSTGRAPATTYAFVRRRRRRGRVGHRIRSVLDRVPVIRSVVGREPAVPDPRPPRVR